MSLAIVREYLKQWNKDKDIIEFSSSTATVPLAAEALGVNQAQIGKSLTFRSNKGAMMIVVSGDMRIDNRKFKQQFGHNPKMLNAEEAFRYTGFNVGGICPFCLPSNFEVYLDDSLKRFESVYLACGDASSMIQIESEKLIDYSRSLGWIDVCKQPSDLNFENTSKRCST